MTRTHLDRELFSLPRDLERLYAIAPDIDSIFQAGEAGEVCIFRPRGISSGCWAYLLGSESEKHWRFPDGRAEFEGSLDAMERCALAFLDREVLAPLEVAQPYHEREQIMPADRFAEERSHAHQAGASFFTEGP